MFVICIIFSIIWSFTNSKLFPNFNFIGLDQYERLWRTDRWIISVQNVFLFGVLSIGSISAWLRPGARQGAVPRRHVQMALRYSSKIEGCPANDMYMVAVAKSSWHPIGRRSSTAHR